MQCETFRHVSGEGWSCDSFPGLDSEQTLVLVFGASRTENLEGLIGELRVAYPRSVLAGCSTAGEIFGDEVFDESLSVAVVRFEHTRLRLVSTLVEEGCDAGEALAGALIDDDLRSVFVLAAGLAVNGTQLAKAFNASLPEDVTVTGGLAGDGADFEKTWVIENDVPVSNRITAVGFYGPQVRVGFGCQGGWDTFGPERRVTKSEGSKLFELDGKPALDVYKRYLGNLAEGLPGTGLLFPLSIQPKANEPELVRTILAVDHEENSMTFAGDIPEGSVARLMRSNLDRVIEGAANASSALLDVHHGDVLSLAISCVGRRLILQHRTDEEIEGVLSNLPVGTQQVGFYSYGELAPWGHLNCGLYNQTMTLTVFSEAKAA